MAPTSFAERLGETAARVYAIEVGQRQYEVTFWSVVGVLAIPVLIAAMVWAVRNHPQLSAAGAPLVVVLPFVLILLLLVITLLYEQAGRPITPEYYGIEQILKTVRGTP